MSKLLAIYIKLNMEKRKEVTDPSRVSIDVFMDTRPTQAVFIFTSNIISHPLSLFLRRRRRRRRRRREYKNKKQKTKGGRNHWCATSILWIFSDRFSEKSSRCPRFFSKVDDYHKEANFVNRKNSSDASKPIEVSNEPQSFVPKEPPCVSNALVIELILPPRREMEQLDQVSWEFSISVYLKIQTPAVSFF